MSDIDSNVRDIFETHRASSWVFEGSRPLNDGMGANGFIIELSNGNLCKLFDRRADEDMYRAQVKLVHETHAMEILEEAGFPAPRLFGPAHAFPTPYAWAAYVMTKLPGCAPAWHRLFENDAHAEERKQKYAIDAGRMIARFHAVMEPHRKRFRAFKGEELDFDHIDPVPFLGDATNAAFAKIDRYLKDNAIPGVVHGDFHSRNIMIDDNGDVSALIDFEHVSETPNIYAEFCCTPSDMLPGIAMGYEMETGQPFDWLLLAATKISAHAKGLDRENPDSPKNLHLLPRIFREIEMLEGLTGYRPPVLQKNLQNILEWTP